MPQSFAVGVFALLAAAAVMSARAPAATVTLNPVKDNTLIEFAAGENSNALGSLFCGRTAAMGGEKRLRAVMDFDVASSIPAGSTITAVTLAMRLEQSNSLNEVHRLHVLTADWGEGTSAGAGGNGVPATPNDATWLHTFFDAQFWNTPGGDFDPASSAMQTVGFSKVDYLWSSSQMVNDVQAWLDDPASDFGWVLIGNEISTNTAKKFYSRHTINEAYRPRLTINYVPGCPANVVPIGPSAATVDVDDLLAVITDWGPCASPPAVCTTNIVNAGTSANKVDVDDLLAVITSWGPCP